MRLKELREEKRLSQSSIASAIGTNQRNIGRWEKDENEPTVGFLIKLADFFDCSIDYIVGREDDFGHINNVTPTHPPLSIQEYELIKLFRTLPKELQQRLSLYAKKIAELNEIENATK